MENLEEKEKNIVFVSVGTSLLTNFKFMYNSFPERFVKEGKTTNEDILSILDGRKSFSSFSKNDIDFFVSYLYQNFCKGMDKLGDWGWQIIDDQKFINKRASAELQSTINFFIQKGWIDDPQDEFVYLIATDTDSCMLAALVVEMALKQGYAKKVKIVRVPQMDIKADYKAGFESLFNTLDDLISNLKNEFKYFNKFNVKFNFTGGFKGVIPKLQQYANVHGYTIFYQYEFQDTIVEVEPFNIGYLALNYVLLRERKHELSNFINNFPKGKEALDILVKKHYFNFNPTKNAYLRTADGTLAYNYVTQLIPTIHNALGFRAEFLVYEMLQREGIIHNNIEYPPLKAKHSTYIGGREFDIFIENGNASDAILGEVKSFLQILDMNKEGAKNFRTQLNKQLDNMKKNRPSVKSYLLFIWGFPNADWNHLNNNLNEIKKIIIDAGFISFDAYCFETKYDPTEESGYAFMPYIQRKGTLRKSIPDDEKKHFIKVRKLLF